VAKERTPASMRAPGWRALVGKERRECVSLAAQHSLGFEKPISGRGGATIGKGEKLGTPSRAESELPRGERLREEEGKECYRLAKNAEPRGLQRQRGKNLPTAHKD